MCICAKYSLYFWDLNLNIFQKNKSGDKDEMDTIWGLRVGPKEHIKTKPYEHHM